MDEVEALEAIYGSDISIEIISDSSAKITKKCIPRTNVYYVEANVEICCSQNSIYGVALTDQKGMADAGAELLNRCRSRIADGGSDELTVFELLEHIIDYLDSVNVPECLICAESCVVSGDGFVKTNCSHIFHSQCLLHWAIICYKQQLQSKEFCDMNAALDVAARSVRGDLRSAEAEIEHTQQQIKRNEEVSAELQTRLAAIESTPVVATAGPHVTVIRSEGVASVVVAKAPKEGKGKGRRGKGAPKEVAAASTAVTTGSSSSSVGTASVATVAGAEEGVEEETETTASINRRLKELEVDSLTAERRLEKLLEKRVKCLQQARRSDQDRAQAMKKWTEKQLFSCPICRHQLNLHDYSLSLPVTGTCSNSDGTESGELLCQEINA